MKSLLFLPLSLLSLTSTVLGFPYLESNSLLNRHDLLILKDENMLATPVGSWPIPMGRLTIDDYSLLPFEEIVNRLQKAYRAKSELGVQTAQISIAARTKSTPFRSFGYQPREEFESSVSTSWLSKWTSGNIQLNVINDSSDGDDFTLDGSSFGVALGNWVVALEQVDRWWGPGWDGSLILSNNARPIPSVSFTRITPDAFENKYLNWIGPWTFNTFLGQLDNDEGERVGSDALLYGVRIETSPFHWNWLDIGLSRTAQWAGEGRPDSLSTFIMLLRGQDNRVPGTNVTEETEPGNQLATIDYRASFSNWNIAQYAQLAGEDEEGFLPDANMVMAGVETWGRIEGLDATWRAYFEWADTRAAYFNAEVRPNGAYNIAYNHFIYQEGYRRRGRAIGHAIDGDSIMRSVGFLLATANGNLFGAKFRNYDINRDGAGKHSVSFDALEGESVEFFAELKLSDYAYIKFGINYLDERNRKTSTSNSDIGGYLSINRSL